MIHEAFSRRAKAAMRTSSQNRYSRYALTKKCSRTSYKASLTEWTYSEDVQFLNPACTRQRCKQCMPLLLARPLRNGD